MAREFFIRNHNKQLVITDSQFPGQTSKSDVEAFMAKLKGLCGLDEYDQNILNIHMFLRANRSMYIKFDGNLEWKAIEVGKIRKIHTKDDAKSDDFFESIMGQMETLGKMNEEVINFNKFSIGNGR